MKEIGVYLLNKNNNVAEEDDGDVLQSFDRLVDDEVNRLQLKLARSLVVFLELIHLLVARNRDLLLAVIQERKGKTETSSTQASLQVPMHSMHSRNKSSSSREVPGSELRQSKSARSTMTNQDAVSLDDRIREDVGTRSHRQMLSVGSLGIDWDMSAHFVDTDPSRTNKAMNIQSELQRAFHSLTKDLYPMILGVMGSETPKWLKNACQESYMKGSAYRNTKIRELFFDVRAAEFFFLFS